MPGYHHLVPPGQTHLRPFVDAHARPRDETDSGFSVLRVHSCSFAVSFFVFFAFFRGYFLSSCVLHSMSSISDEEVPAAAAPRVTDSGRRWFTWRLAGKLALELLVVFTGVFLASLVDQWKSDQTQKANQREVLSLLEQSYRYQADGMDAGYTGFHQKYTEFMKQYLAGNMPELDYEIFNSGFDSGFWHALLATGAGNGLDPALLMELQLGDAEARILVNLSDRINQMMTTILAPSLGLPRAEFYDDASKLYD
jgi:hypothetical protein